MRDESLKVVVFDFVLELDVPIETEERLFRFIRSFSEPDDGFFGCDHQHYKHDDKHNLPNGNPIVDLVKDFGQHAHRYPKITVDWGTQRRTLCGFS